MLLSRASGEVPDDLRKTRDDDPLLVIENLSEVAYDLDQKGMDAVAAAVYRQQVETADRLAPEYLGEALFELRRFAVEHPAYAADGVAAAQRELLVTHDPECYIRLDLARLYVHQGELKRAETLFQELLANEPDDPVIRLRWAEHLAGQGRTHEAGAVYRQLTDLDEDSYIAGVARKALASLPVE